MNKKFLIIISSIAILIIGLVTSASLYKDKLVEINYPDSDAVETVDTSALQTRRIILSDNEERPIQYDRTIKENELEYELYYDQSGGQYWFDLDGKLINYRILDHIKKSDVALTEQQLTDIAQKYLYKQYGKDVEDYLFKSLIITTQGNNGIEEYMAVFSKRYGKDGFLIGEECYVDIAPDGYILGCSNSYGKRFKDFDFNRLNSLDYDTLKDYAVQRVKKQYGDSLSEYEIEEMYLQKIDGKYYVNIPIGVTYKDSNDMEIAVGEGYHYEIPQ